MKTLINESCFEAIRTSYQERDVTKIKRTLIPLLHKISKSDVLFEKLRFHPLGFIYCKLFEYSNHETLRIHIWNSKSKILEPIMNIHNHFYDVNSFILCGHVYNNLFQVSDENSPTHCIYTGSYLNVSTRILTKTDLYKNLRLINSQIISKDSLYSIEKSEIHAGGSLNDETTITVVLTANPGNPEPLVFGPITGKKEYVYESNLVNREIVELIKTQIASV